MFEGERTRLFWAGLIVLGFGLLALFTIVWLVFVHYPTHHHAYHWDYPKHFLVYFWKYYVWFIIGAIAFILMGMYAMKSGVRKRKEGGN